MVDSTFSVWCCYLNTCYSGSSVHVELASLSWVAMTVSAEGVSGTFLDMSNYTQASLQAVCVALISPCILHTITDCLLDRRNFTGPLVTSVGGTASGMESNNPEIANRVSGGGFSDIFRLFEFQAPATTTFLGSISNQYSSLYKCVYSCRLTQPTHSYLRNLCSPVGQGVPDIAMQSFNYQIILNCRGYQIDSTSCVTHVRLTPFLIPSLWCPSSVTWLISNEQTMVALFSLLNDFLISNHRPLLGWLNPWLYDPIIQAVGFNDISTRNNPGCHTLGFFTADGWDPVCPAMPSSLCFWHCWFIAT